MADNSGLIVSALLKTDPELARAIDAENAWKDDIKKRGARVKLYRDYERGDHRANITNEMRKMLRIKNDDAKLSDFNDNYMRVVVDKMAGRLFVSNIKIDNDAAEKWLSDMLAYQDFDAQQNEWFRGAIRDGDSYVMVDNKTMRWVSEPAYNGYDGIVCIFNSITKKAIWACKLWSEANISDSPNDSNSITMKIVVYQPDEVSYWSGKAGMNEVKADDTISDKKAWTLGRLPLIYFGNQKDNFTDSGESELRPAIPLQDVLNRTLHSMVMASELSAFKIYWSIGMEINKDGITPGSVINLVLKGTDEDGNGYVITDFTPEQIEFMKSVKVGEFAETDISQYTNQISAIVQQISQSTQTPIYGVTAQGNLSGEALKQLEIGLLGKIERFQHQNTDALRELIALTAQMQNTFENDLGEAPKFKQINVIWKSPEILDVNSRIGALVNLREKAPGLFANSFYIKRIGVLLGMSQNDINQEIENAQNEQSNFFGSLLTAGGEQTA